MLNTQLLRGSGPAPPRRRIVGPQHKLIKNVKSSMIAWMYNIMDTGMAVRPQRHAPARARAPCCTADARPAVLSAACPAAGVCAARARSAPFVAAAS